MNKKFVLILLDIRSAQNVGSIFRSADAVGITKIYLVGYTPCPIDRFGRLRSDIAKASLGAEKTVEWEHKKDIVDLIEELKKDGYDIMVLEQDTMSVDYKDIKISNKTAMIVGNEVTGVPKEILEKCDKIIEIPMKGEKESLNVSVAVGIAIFRLLDR